MSQTLSCWLSCIRGCPGRYAVTEGRTTCPTCGGLLDVEHDLDALRARSAEAWKNLFRERTMASWPYASGVWRKKEWVLPEIDNRNIVSLGEGNTPLLYLPKLGKTLGMADFWLKQCGTSHSGSFKDLGMTVLISAVKQRLSLGKPIDAVICASSGDTSASLAAYGAAAGVPVVVVLPKGKISEAQLAQPLACGALVLAVDSDFDGCMAMVRELAMDEGIYLANSMNALRLEGQKTVAVEIIEQLEWESPDWIVLPCGNLGNISALAKGVSLMRELGMIDKIPRLAAVQAEQANPLYRSFLTGFSRYEPVEAGRTLATAIQIGTPVSYERAVSALRQVNGVVVQASEQELADAAAHADRYGLYTCPQTGVALAGAAKLARDGTIRASDRVVVVSTAHGLKFTSFKMRTGETPRSHPAASRALGNRPTGVACDHAAIRRIVYDYIGKSRGRSET